MAVGRRVNPILEVCVDGPVGVATAAACGADRVELCAGLNVGGITPSLGAVRLALRQDIPVHVLVRPRSGGFQYNATESQTMLEDISELVGAGVNGIVVGGLDSNNDLDSRLLSRLLSACGDLPVTLHRCFDYARNTGDALEQAIELGFSRILTSGRQPDVLQGRECLGKLFEQAGDRIIIIPGGGVTTVNLPRLLAELPLSEVHASCKRPVIESEASEIALGSISDDIRFETCADTVRAIRNILDRT